MFQKELVSVGATSMAAAKGLPNERAVTNPARAPWIQVGVPAIVLAPMEGVADAVMRALLSELGGYTFCVAEFLRISKAVPGERVFQRHVPELMHEARTPSGLPVQVQLLGGDAGKLAQAALASVRAGARAVDLNFGCPARTVNRHDGGATLLQYPDRLREIVAAVRAAVPGDLPVSAKMRLGWDNIHAIHVNAERAAEGGADWITIHARTKSQGYKLPAYWKPLAEVRARLGIPVVANGEIWTIDDLCRCRDETGCQHFMLGRGALADPTLGRQAARELGIPGAGLLQYFGRTPAEWLPLISRYDQLCRASGMPQAYILARVKQWLRMNNHDGKQAWFDALKGCQNLEELLNSLAGLKSRPGSDVFLGTVDAFRQEIFGCRPYEPEA